MYFTVGKSWIEDYRLNSEISTYVQESSDSFNGSETRGTNTNSSQENTAIQAEKTAISDALEILKDVKPNYRKALAHLNDVKPDKYKQTITMLKAICHIQLKEKDEALKLLATVTKANDFGGDDIRKANEWREFLEKENF